MTGRELKSLLKSMRSAVDHITNIEAEPNNCITALLYAAITVSRTAYPDDDFQDHTNELCDEISDIVDAMEDQTMRTLDRFMVEAAAQGKHVSLARNSKDEMICRKCQLECDEDLWIKRGLCNHCFREFGLQQIKGRIWEFKKAGAIEVEFPKGSKEPVLGIDYFEDDEEWVKSFQKN